MIEPQVKEVLLRRKFLSLEYIRYFLSTYKDFLIVGLNAYDDYLVLPEKPVKHPNFKSIEADIWLWDKRWFPISYG